MTSQSRGKQKIWTIDDITRNPEKFEVLLGSMEMGSGKKVSNLIIDHNEQGVMSIQVCLPSGRYIDDPFASLQSAAKQQHSRLFMNGAGHYRYSDDAAVQAPNDAQGNPHIPDVAGKGYIILKTINGVPLAFKTIWDLTKTRSVWVHRKFGR